MFFAAGSTISLLVVVLTYLVRARIVTLCYGSQHVQSKEYKKQVLLFALGDDCYVLCYPPKGIALIHAEKLKSSHVEGPWAMGRKKQDRTVYVPSVYSFI